MNWIFLVESNLSGQYAIRTHVLELCHSLSKNVQIQLFSQSAPDGLGNEKETGFNISRLPSLHLKPNNISEIVNTFLAYRALSRQHKSQPVDVLYIRATAYGIGPLLFARRKGIPHILEVNGAWDAENALSRQKLSPLKRAWVAPIQGLRNRSLDLACKLAEQIVVVTPQLVEYLKAKGIQPGKIHAVPNGVNPEHFSPRPREGARRHLSLPEDAQITGFVGSLAAWQGVDTLISAFDSLDFTTNDKQYLLIVGDGAERQRLENQAMRCSRHLEILFTGKKPYPEIPDYIAACDLLVAPKRPLVSGYSTLKVFEYLSCARPVVAARLPGLELVEQKGAGMLYLPNDSQDLAHALKEMLNLSETERTAMGERGRKLILGQYTWDHTAASILNLV